MFDKLIDFLIDMIDKLMPVFIINQYNGGVLLRRGKFVKKVTGGIYFKIPFLDEVLSHSMVPTTLILPAQSLMTKDKKHVVVRAIIKYRIEDIETFLLEVNDAEDAVSDTTQGIIKNIVMTTDLNDINPDTDAPITIASRKEAKKWGIKIMEVVLTNIGEIRSIRLFQETTDI